MIQKILVPYNGVASADAAFNFALGLAKTYNSPVYVLAVIQLAEPPMEVETEATIDNSTKHYHKYFTELHRKAQTAGVTVHASVVTGHPEEQILMKAEKENIDVIVMGHQTRGKFGRWFIGSVTDRVVDHAQCTVIVVKRDHTKK
jgi:nucleotide-binding universal stress UspA family protein